MKIAHYNAVTSYSPSSLTALVNEKLEAGWQPQGGITSYVGTDGKPYFVQAIVQYQEQE
jgi:Domain of unknown function (DUF1737)